MRDIVVNTKVHKNVYIIRDLAVNRKVLEKTAHRITPQVRKI